MVLRHGVYLAYERAGATWWLTQLPMGVTRCAARARLRAGPP
ncbi:hypothetical protein [Nocardia neocaledoniensis]|nr:hypothetical protein [Nocardia neocaledoniensis]